MTTGPRDILLVHNGSSRASRDACERAAGILRAGGYRARPLASATPRGLSELLTDTLRRESQAVAAVVAVGGDGMVHLVLQCLDTLNRQGVDLPFGLVPAGSGNDLARHHGVPSQDVERAAGRVLRGLESAPRRTDLLRVECADGTRHVCATAVCLGLDARINARANRWSRVRASAKYVVALAVDLVSLRARPYQLSWTSPDGSEHTAARDLTLLTLANTSSIGGGLTIVPAADAGDGTAELFMVSDVGPLKFVVSLPRLWLGSHVTLPEVAVEPAVSASVAVSAHATGHSPGGDMAFGDGERLGPLPVTLRVLPAAVQILF